VVGLRYFVKVIFSQKELDAVPLTEIERGASVHSSLKVLETLVSAFAISVDLD